MKSILRLGEGVLCKKVKEIISDCMYIMCFWYLNKGKLLNLIVYFYCVWFVCYKSLYMSVGIYIILRDMFLK